MFIKVFQADTMVQALKMVKETLGPEALIISTRTLRNSGLGLFGKSSIEITAAIDSISNANHLPVPLPAASVPAHTYPEANTDHECHCQVSRSTTMINNDLADKLIELKQILRYRDLSDLRNEIADLKKLVCQERPSQAARPAMHRNQQINSAITGPLGAPLQALIENLIRLDIQPDTAETLGDYANERMILQQLSSPGMIERFLGETIAELVQFNDFSSPNPSGQARIALVGPTGVGKTTTIAKLAADRMQQTNDKIALFTIDTYRIAAVEQLKAYADIMGLPIEIIYSPEMLEKAFARHTDTDLILIDTTGRSPRDANGLAELQAFLCRDLQIQKHLVVPAGARIQDLTAVVEHFSRLNASSLIFTKLDECRERGALLELPLRQNLPLSYLTIGQQVPEDILTANPELVAGYLFGKH